MNTQSEVIKIISEVFDFPIENIKNDMTSDDIKKWDSLQQINLIMTIESKFNIHFDMDDIFKIKSIDSIIHIVKSKL